MSPMLFGYLFKSIIFYNRGINIFTESIDINTIQRGRPL